MNRLTMQGKVASWVLRNCLLLVTSFILASCAELQSNEAGQRVPGTLLLNILTMNEAQNLDRTLPIWAEIIDYWIIGIGATLLLS